MPNPNLPIAGDYNVYVGARYVPLIKGQWSETVAYEPLSIVVFEGNSYTSKTFVPAGVPVTNETYWAATGNFNSQVEQYRQETLQLQKTVNELQNTINQLPASTRPNLDDRYFLFVGDSYMAATANYALLATQNLGLSADHYSILGINGMAMSPMPDYADVLSTIRSWTENNPTQAAKITDIYITLGYNDSTRGITKTQIQTAINNVYNYLEAHYPNVNYNLGMTGFANASLNQLINVSKWYKEAWIKRGGKYLPRMCNVLAIPGNIGNDKIHPTEQGQHYLSQYLTQAILGQPFSFIQYVSLPTDWFTPTSGFALGDIDIGFYVQEGGVQIQLSCSLPNSAGGALSGNLIKLGTLSNTFWFNDLWLSGGIRVNTTSNQLEGNTGYIRLLNNEIYLYYQPIGDANTFNHIIARVSGYYNYLPE